MREILVDNIYHHFKGNDYKVICIAKDSETLEEKVVYEALYGEHDIWVRPYETFNSLVDINKYPTVKQKYRFEFKK